MKLLKIMVEHKLRHKTIILESQINFMLGDLPWKLFSYLDFVGVDFVTLPRIKILVALLFGSGLER
jgi:riboflavin transporter FmnP